MIALPVDARRIGECVGFHAAREPGREAAVHDRTRLAYRDLDRVVTRWGAALLAAGVARGDRVADASGAIAEPGGQGEIQARGDWLLAGYFRDPEATADAYTSDGWFRTGDVVRVWTDGNLEIVGRTKEMYISGGFNIYPREVEIAIEAHPDVGLVAVLGVPDETFGEVAHAFVEPKPGASLDAAVLDEWCRERLANYKTPKRFEVHAELPRLPIGKIDKQALKRKLAGRSD